MPEQLVMTHEVTGEEGSGSPWWVIQGTARGVCNWLQTHKISKEQVINIEHYGSGDDGSSLFTATIKHAG